VTSLNRSRNAIAFEDANAAEIILPEYTPRVAKMFSSKLVFSLNDFSDFSHLNKPFGKMVELQRRSRLMCCLALTDEEFQIGNFGLIERVSSHHSIIQV